MVQVKYSIRQVNVQVHGRELYLCKHEDGVYFSYTDYSSELFFFDFKKDAIDYIDSKKLRYCEIFEVYYCE